MQAKYVVATAIGGFALGIGAASLLRAQGTAPNYEVAEINVKDQAAYEKRGVDKVRDAIKASGGKVIAGGYNKAHSYVGAPPANRFLIIEFPNKEASPSITLPKEPLLDLRVDAMKPLLRAVGSFPIRGDFCF
jgi:uncharacterized protein (DUF1330 family)